MALKVERKRHGGPERRVLIGMLVSRRVLGPIAARWEPGLFPSRYAALLGGWAVDHFRRYGRAPGKGITSYFDAWARTARDDETVAAVESLLQTLSDEYARLKDEMSPDLLIDMAAALFNRNRLVDLRGRIDGFLEAGDEKKAEEAVAAFRRVELGAGSGIDVVEDREAMVSAFEQRSECLVEYDGALKSFFANTLVRDAFVAFVGFEKAGKSYFLQDLAWRAVCQGRRVVYFEAGDHSQHQILRRFAVRAAGRPLKAGRWECPIDLDSPGKDQFPGLRTEWREEDTPLTAQEALAAMRKAAPANSLQLSCHPNSTLSVAKAESILEGWERDEWEPDIIAVDYPDIMAPLNAREDAREQVNETWKALRSLSQKTHALVACVTQANRASYSAPLITREHMSEDKRKLAHVTAMIGINQKPSEKNQGLYRLNYVAGRELDFPENKVVWCAGNLAVGNPGILSTF